jgi:L-erythro-3,5-diaminohexanoate dehydrogenase
MATSFTAAALGAEGVAADVTMLVGNGYVPGHAQLALDLIRSEQSVKNLFESRLGEHQARGREPGEDGHERR